MGDKMYKVIKKTFIREKKKLKKEIKKSRRGKYPELSAVERAVVLELIELNMQLYEDWRYERNGVKDMVFWVRESCIDIKIREYTGNNDFYIVEDWSKVNLEEPEVLKEMQEEYSAYLDGFCDEKMKYYTETLNKK